MRLWFACDVWRYINVFLIFDLIVLYTLSRYAGVPSRFMAVASQYGIHSLLADCWNCQVCCLEVFYRDCSYLDCAYFILSYCCIALLLYCTFVWVFYVLYVCILSLPSGVIKNNNSCYFTAGWVDTIQPTDLQWTTSANPWCPANCSNSHTSFSFH